VKKRQVKIGQRVEISDGVLKGERATITAHPQTGQYMDKDGFVWLTFERHNARLGREKGYAILSPQWFEIERLRPING
jgi:hypothetical protein